MDITAYAGMTTVGVDCLHEIQPSSGYDSSIDDRYDFPGTFDRDMYDLPNPRSITLDQIVHYIEHVTEWPSMIELPNGAASIINPVILKMLLIINPGCESSDSPDFHNYHEIKNIYYDMIGLVRSHLVEMIKQDEVNNTEFRHTQELLAFFEAMASGDRFHVDRFIRTFS